MEQKFNNYQEMLMDSLAKDLVSKNDERIKNALIKKGINVDEKYLKEHCEITS